MDVACVPIKLHLQKQGWTGPTGQLSVQQHHCLTAPPFNGPSCGDCDVYMHAVQYSGHKPHMASAPNVASVTEVLNYKLYLILINLNLTSHMWLVDSTVKLKLFDIPLLKLSTPQATVNSTAEDPNLTKGQSVGGPRHSRTPSALPTLGPSLPWQFCSPEHPLSPESVPLNSTVPPLHLRYHLPCHPSEMCCSEVTPLWEVI